MLALRLAKIGCVATIALYMALVAFGNVTDYWTNFRFVSHVLSMDQLPPGSAIRWRALNSPIFHHAGYILIILTEIAIAALCAAGSFAMFVQLQTNAQSFHDAKWLAVAGLALTFVLFEGGFIAIGGEWFGMWQTPTWNGVESSFRVAVTALAVLIFVSLRDNELS
jgi:predicted small integral membrane protein